MMNGRKAEHFAIIELQSGTRENAKPHRENKGHQKNSVFRLWVMMSTSMFLPMIFIIRR